MLALSSLAWLTLFAALLGFWWQSDRVKALAMSRVYQYCRAQNLQLLDQTMVLKGISLRRNPAGSISIQRRYEFEFTSTGEMRHLGKVVLLGNQIENLEVDAYIIPESDQTLQ